MSRPTPETDAARAEESRVTGGQNLHLVHYRVAERLERQRDEARELAEKWRDTAGDCAAMPITEEKFPWEVLP